MFKKKTAESPPLHSKRTATIELLLCSSIWGFSFIATRWALSGLSPLWVTAARFSLAFFVGAPLLLLPRFFRQLSFQQFFLAMLPGLFVSATLLFQGYGLNATTVTRGGFITCLYVVIVPILESLFLKKRISRLHWFWVLLALVGAGFICQLSDGEWRSGDLWMLASALMASLQILNVELVSDKITSAFLFNLFQTFWAGLFPVVIALSAAAIPFRGLPEKCWFGLFCLAVPTTLVSFMVQIRSQRVLSPSVVSMIFLLESPLAAFFAYLFFGEIFTVEQWMGALFILIASAGSLRADYFLDLNLKE